MVEQLEMRHALAEDGALTVSGRNLSAIRLHRRCGLREVSQGERRLVMRRDVT